MASRRKSSKPTNKLRKVLTSCDEDEDSDLDSNERTKQNVESDTTLCGENEQRMANGCLLTSTQGHLQSVVSQMSSSALLLKYPSEHSSSQSTSQNIALPFDVLRDFEALKSATNLDSSQLIRKLLKDYQKLTCGRPVDLQESHSGPDSGNEGQSLDFQNFSSDKYSNSDILDLSAHGKTTAVHESPEPVAKYHALTDDQIAMGNFALEDLNTSVTPLDLTVPKHNKVTSLTCQEMKDVNTTANTHASSSLFSASFPTTPHTSSDIVYKPNHAGMYVINLESDVPHPDKTSTSAHWECFQNTSTPTLSSQITETEVRHFNYDKIPSSSNIHSLPVNKQEELTFKDPVYDSNAPLSTEAFRKSKLPALSLPLSLSSSNELPSYSQAISLSTCLSAKDSWTEISNNSKECKNSANDSGVRLSKEGKRVSVLQLKPGSLERRPTETGGKLRISDQSSDHSASNTSSSVSSEKEHTFLSSTSLPFYNNLLPSTTAVSFQSSYQISCPNFLISSPTTDSAQDTTSTPILATVPSSGPDGTPISGAMQIPALIMTTGPGGVIGNVLAIPILQGPAEDGSAPNYSFTSSITDAISKDVTPSSSTQTSVVISDISPSVSNELRPIPTPDRSKVPIGDSPHVIGLSSPERICADIADKCAAATSVSRASSLSCEKNSRKSSNKDIKLLTENALFPGVYTSILKLPWSKRTRNKSKSKSLHDKKKKQNKAPRSKRSASGRRSQSKEEEEDKRLHASYYGDSLFLDGPDTKLPAKEKDIKTTSFRLTESLRERTSDIQSKDLEQQKRLHFQYHVRLQEEQQKLKREMDTSLGKVSESPISLKRAKPSCSLIRPSPLLKPLDSEDQNYSQSEIRHNVMLSSASLPSANELPSSSCLDPIMLVYPNVGPTTSPKSRRRGRPPKMPMMSSRISESSLFPLDSVFSAVDSQSEATLFPSINTSMPSSMLSPDTIQTLPVNSSSLSSSDINSGEFEEKANTRQSTVDSSMDGQMFREKKINYHAIQNESTVDSSTDGQMSLEKKINYLTNQIEIEMAQNRAKNDGNANLSESNQRDETTGQSTCKMPEGKSLENVKTRRKKTSRMLKSNENFIYATFRFKPRGSHAGVKKSGRKNKEVSGSAAAAAETIASLKGRKLKGSLGDKSKGTSKLDPLVHAWKFHEQYPCFPSSPKPSSTVPASCVCLTCGSIFENSLDLQNQQTQCDSCLLSSKQMEFSRCQEEERKCNTPLVDEGDNSKGDNRYRREMEKALTIETTFSDGTGLEKPNQGNVEKLPTTCIKCGKTFLKPYADPSVQCFSCKQLISSVINSSKLFSLPSSCQTSSDATHTDDSPIRDPSQYEGITGQHISQKTNGLFCSKCRMQFIEVVDYLNHIKKTHEQCEEPTTKGASPVCQSATYTAASGRKGKMSTKNKKSLSHKTITCPVEDCPLFFRHQRDMDFHLKKAHHADYCLPTASSDANLPKSDGDQPCPSANLNVAGSSGGTVEVKTSPVAESTSPSQEKPLQCDICDFRCRQKNALTWHMRKHPEAAWQHRRYSSMSVE